MSNQREEARPFVEEPDWTQQDPTGDQIREWMREHKGRFAMFDNDSALLLARAANDHFARPFHINVLTDMARKIFDERQNAE